MSEVEWLDIFSDNLRDLMEERGYSQRDLAETTGLSESAISMYLNKQRIPNVRAITNIVYELGLSFDDLLDLGDRFD